MERNSEMKFIAAKGFENNNYTYQIVDFLNKSLKEYGIIFGLTRKDESDIITIYESNDRKPVK